MAISCYAVGHGACSRGGSRLEDVATMRKKLMLPLSAGDARALRAGDEVLVSGRLVTGRDAAHRYLARHDDPSVRQVACGSLVYHCGPIVARHPGAAGWRFTAAGPSASIRCEPYQAEVLARYGLRGIIGKGGMGPATLRALREHGAVYLHALGGLAVVLAKCVTAATPVRLLEELGPAEAIWSIRVADFPAVVTMDSHGESLHAVGDPSSAAASAP